MNELEPMLCDYQTMPVRVDGYVWELQSLTRL